MALYTGFDLHSNNSYVGIIDETGERVWKKKLSNDPRLISEMLKPFKKDIEGIVVESTYNWYWLVDLLMEEGYRVYLANSSKIKQYSGVNNPGLTRLSDNLGVVDDKIDGKKQTGECKNNGLYSIVQRSVLAATTEHRRINPRRPCLLFD